MRSRSRQSVRFEGLADKPVVVSFELPAQSSDGGALLLAAVDRRLGLTERLAGALREWRQEGKIEHPLPELVAQRTYAIACGYPDGNDLGTLRTDPVMKLVCGRPPLAVEEALASQPTASRFENAVRRTDLLRMGYALTDTVIAEQRRRRRHRPPRRITIDMDPTEDPTHGEQQLTFFNAFYDSWCYLPMVTTIGFDAEPEQWVVAPLLRPGNAPGKLGARGILRRLLPRLRAAFPGVRLRVRLDGSFAAPEVLDYLESEGVEYFVNLPKNSVLERRAEPLMRRVRRQAHASGQRVTAFSELFYKAGRWVKPRRVLLKAEVVVTPDREPRDNPRFVVTNSQRCGPESGYRIYAARGEMENRIKELSLGLAFDRTSCSRFSANQLRNLLTAAAYVLYQHLRRAAAGTEWARTQVEGLRLRAVKIAVVVLESVRRIRLVGPLSYPWLTTWRRVAMSCGALSG